ncbi:tRNA(m5U54)methyltransferase [Lithohypha guttulata]|uniref:tRNA(M5U54)methyltransferase n=1 Tax=Lithohypha guttulata TaxID=1690604 RepID=A0AAN7SZA5_9EURO|nr:tRNA(m5U54)methyltransferase [Lithohypha guttulata]
MLKRYFLGLRSRPVLRSAKIKAYRCATAYTVAQAPEQETLLQAEKYDAIQIAMEKKRKYDFDKLRKPRLRKTPKTNALLPEGSNEEILDIEVANLLSKVFLTESSPTITETHQENDQHKAAFNRRPQYKKPTELGQEVELEIVELSSTGDGLAYNEAKDHIFVVPFTLPGDRVLAKPWTWSGDYTLADFVQVLRPSSSREGVTPPCPYFAKCSGCQFQMLPYEKQLEHKRQILQGAFRNFSGLRPEQMPEIEPTMGSPLQYGYRTKLTPHFDGPRTVNRKRMPWEGVPEIGFNMKGKRKVLDIEKCPIGTDILQVGLRIERKKVVDNLETYTNGATILLRESTQRLFETANENGTPADTSADMSQASSTIPSDVNDQDLQSTNFQTFSTSTTHETPSIKLKYSTHTDLKTYISDNEAQASEYITTTINPTTTPPTTATYHFTNFAGSFFQNNNSILGPFTSYIYEKCIPKSQSPKTLKYLLDAYSGSGLFTLTLSTHFISSLGIDIDPRAIKTARSNAERNNITNAGFIDADASALFADVPYPADQTVVVIDPPRKGCDREFLKQLRRYGPKRVIYVSCNVHTQARDVGILVSGFRRDSKGRYTGDDSVRIDEKWEEDGLCRYEIESLRGFDFFPQTGHVEGVCVLNRVDG